MARSTDLSSNVRSKLGETRGTDHSLCQEWSVVATRLISMEPTWGIRKFSFAPIAALVQKFTCRKDMLSVSFRASMQNWRRAVVCCRRAVQVATCSFSARTRRSLSWRMQSNSCDRRLCMASIRASHCADTIDSNFMQLSWKQEKVKIILPSSRSHRIYYKNLESGNLCF